MPLKVLLGPNLGRWETTASLLEKEGYEIVRLPVPEPGERLSLTPAQIEEYFGQADAFMSPMGAAGMMVTREMLEAGKKLRVGASPIIGTENIDVEAATELGIAIGFGAAPENFLGVAEAVVMLAAALVKQLPSKWNTVRSGGWRVDFGGHMLQNSTVGLIGFGNIGQGVAKRLKPWDCRIIATDPYANTQIAKEMGVELVDMDTLLRESDVVSIMVTLGDSTRHLIGEHELSLMKPTAYLINTARGACVDEKALIRALDEDRLAGAGIDVWEQEPADVNNPLRTNDKVITTAHNIGHSEELYERLPYLAAENLIRGLRGNEPVCLRNPAVLPRWHERLQRLGVEGLTATPPTAG
jgi:phosphoglycerate dehydrogenase-like enzyme